MKSVATLPEVSAAVDGTPLPTSVVRTLHRVRIQQRLAVPGQCELVFSPPPSDPDARPRLGPGRRLQLRVGDQDEMLFAGEVTATEHCYGPTGQQELRVRAYDRLHRLRKRQPVRAHRQVTPRELAEELTADLDVTVEAADPGPPWEQIIQHRQSDFELLVEITQRYGLYPFLRGDVLHLLTLEGRPGRALPLKRGDTLLEATIERNEEAACRRVAAAGWDPLRIEERFGESTRSRVDRPGADRVPPDALGGSGERHLTGLTGPDNRHLDAVAQAELDRRTAHETVLRGVADGDPRLQPGTPVEVTGVAGALEGRYVLTSVVHTIDGERGFVSDLSSAVPPPVDTPGGTLATLGVVTQVNDPEDLGRVKVVLPAYADIETQWLHGVSPGAGAEKGLTAVPDVDDTVLVLCSDRDPGAGVVLGGLYGMDGPPDSGVEGNAVRRYTFRTPGGHRIQLDDDTQTLHMEASSGSRIELSPERVYLHAAADLEMEAPGQSVIIRGQRIDFQRG